MLDFASTSSYLFFYVLGRDLCGEGFDSAVCDIGTQFPLVNT